MQVHRFIAKLIVAAGIALALTVAVGGTSGIAGAQTGGDDGGYEGSDEGGYEGGYDGGYEATDDCPAGYEGYEGCDEQGGTATAPEETAAPVADSGGTGGTLPNTGGVTALAGAGALAGIGLALRRLSRS